MAKNKGEESSGVIEKANYIDSVEAEVKSYMKGSIDLPIYTEIPLRSELADPKDLSPLAYKSWMLEELHRCKFGYGNMTGKMYFYFNYVKIKNLSKGSFRPDFRSADAEWFKLVEECGESNEFGVVCVKRRRAGFSWKAAADALQDVLFNQHYHVGMNSKSDKDSIHLFNKVVFIYQNLPGFMRANIGRKHGMTWEFFTEKLADDGVKERGGNQSSIEIVVPTVSAYEGRALSKWVSDESGKIEHLMQLWSFTEDCLMEEMLRVGMPILFGTSGEVDKAGAGLMHMWNKAEYYKLKRFFFAGWMGLGADEFGNDNKEETIRWILYNRQLKEKISSKAYNDFLQKYPLTIEEAFSQATGGIGDVIRINAQKATLNENPPIISTGVMNHDIDSGSPKFTPKRFGEVKIYEHPKPGATYLSAADPADHDDAGAGTSDLSLHIMSLPDGNVPAKLVMEYVDRPPKLASYFEQASMCLSYYNNAKVLVENNRIRMIDYFKENGYQSLLQVAPQPINGIFKTKAGKFGVRMTEDFKRYMESLIEEYIDAYCEYIPSVDLLNEFGMYGSSNTDRVMSFGILLTFIREKMKTFNPNRDDLKKRLPSSKVIYKNGITVKDGMREARSQPSIPGRSKRASMLGR